MTQPQIIIKNPEKAGENVLKVTRDVIGVEATYTYEFLISQRKAIEDDLKKYQAMRQIELEEVNTLIAECEKLGIKAKPKMEKEEP